MALLSWDLVSPTEYAEGQELSFNLHFEAPADTEAKKYYILGYLYTTDGTYIPDTKFGILRAAEVDYGVNDPVYMSLWELEPEQAADLPCRFILDRSDVILGLFLMRMVGDAPSLVDDEQIAQVQAQLTAPQTGIGSLLTSIMPLIMMMMVFMIIIPMTKGISGESNKLT